MAPTADGGPAVPAADRAEAGQPAGPGGPGGPGDPAGSSSPLGALADAVPHLVWVADADGVVLTYNRRIEDYSSARRHDGDRWRWELLIHPDDLADTAEAWQAADGTGTYEHEHRLRMSDGTYRWHLSRGVRSTDQDSGAVRWYGTATDIDAGRRAEDLLRQTQRSLALAMRGGRMGWWTRDLRTDAVTWSPELEEIFGLPAGSFRGSEADFLALVHPDDREAVMAAIGDAIANRTDYVAVFRFRHADGSWRWMDGRGVATYEDDRAVFLYGIGTDITERMEAEAAVRASEERFRIAAQFAGIGLYEVDLETGASYWSPELRQIVGLADDAPAVDPVLAPAHPDDRAEALARLAASQEPTGDGVFEHEFRIVRSDESIRWVAMHGRTLFSAPDPGPNRRVLRSVGIVQDVTERRQTDEIRDVFIGMLSHELRTPVTAIYGGSQLLRRDQLADDARREIVDGIVGESERLERLVENLLVLAKAERQVVESGHDPVLLRPIITRIVADKLRRWPGSRIVVDVEPGLPPALWDEGSTELVLRNLISNALKYGGNSEVSVSARPVGDEIEIAVADGGPGLPAGDSTRLFELFYRTDDARRRAQGAGIGLFVVRALVESAGGSVWARNRDGGGAVFGFRLPRFVEADDAAALD